MNAFLFTILLALTAQNAVYAGDFSKDAIGTTGAQFLELPVGARAIAMGSAAGASANDVTALYYNPAGIAPLKGINISLTHSIYFQNISYQYAAISKAIDKGVLAAGIQYLGYGTLEEVDNTGIETGSSFAPKDIAATLGYGVSLGRFDLGVSGKYISSKIQKSAHSYAADFGIKTEISKIMAVAVSVVNIGKGLKYFNQTDSLPTAGRLGSLFKISDKILFSTDIIVPKGASGYFASGVEYCVYKSQNLAFFSRAGYNGRNSSSKLENLTGLNAGAGFEFSGLTIDYAWTSFGDLGNVQRISLGLRFGNKRA